MKIHPDRLRRLRKEKGLSRVQLARLSKVSERTIQRLENESEHTQTNREYTLECLAKVLDVEEGVLAGDAPFPDTNKPPEPERVQIGAQIAPKARLAYDLVKRRYGVSATELINMAPLFFALLAEGSLAKRLKNLEKGREAHLGQIGQDIGHRIFSEAAIVADNADMAEEESIAKADLFGDHLLDGDGYASCPFDPTAENPFAGHLRRLAANLDPDVVKVESGDLSYGSPWLRFPDYDLCANEFNGITNGSPDARRALENGFARLSDIPGELEGEDAGEKRAAWLQERLPDIYKDVEGKPMARVAKSLATSTLEQKREFIEKLQEKSASDDNHETQAEKSTQ